MTHRLITALMALVLFILTTAAAIIPGAADNAYNWYCIRTPGNKRPPCPAEMSFVDKLGGFYIDKNKTDSDTDKQHFIKMNDTRIGLLKVYLNRTIKNEK